MVGPDYIVDLSGKPHANTPTGDSPPSTAPRPWLAIRWQCCATYSRVYRNRSRTAYEGHCPKCARAIKVPIGPGGTNNRFFDAY